MTVTSLVSVVQANSIKILVIERGENLLEKWYTSEIVLQR